MSERANIAKRRLAPRIALARWALTLVAAAAAIPLTKVAYDTGFNLREREPCASGWDNVWSILSSATLWVALISALVLVVLAARGKRAREATLGGVAIALILILSAACWIYANGDYGWHC